MDSLLPGVGRFGRSLEGVMDSTFHAVAEMGCLLFGSVFPCLPGELSSVLTPSLCFPQRYTQLFVGGGRGFMYRHEVSNDPPRATSVRRVRLGHELRRTRQRLPPRPVQDHPGSNDSTPDRLAVNDLLAGFVADGPAGGKTNHPGNSCPGGGVRGEKR